MNFAHCAFMFSFFFSLFSILLDILVYMPLTLSRMGGLHQAYSYNSL